MALRGLVSDYIVARDWGYMFCLYLLMNILRFTGVFVFYPVLRRGSYGIDKRQALVLGYSGLRGAVGLTLAIAIHQDSQIPMESRDRILFHVAGCSLLSLLINGTTLKPLISALGLNKESPAEKEVYERTSIALEQRVEDRVMELKREPFLGDADWGLVWRYLPVLTRDVYWHRFRQGRTLLTSWEAEYMSLRSNASSSGQSGGRKHAKAQEKAAAAAAAKANASAPLSTASNLKGVPNRLRRTWRRYAQLYNELEGPSSEGLRQLRTGLLDAWRNRLTVEEHMEHEQDQLAGDQYVAAAAAGAAVADGEAQREGVQHGHQSSLSRSTASAAGSSWPPSSSSPSFVSTVPVGEVQRGGRGGRRGEAEGDEGEADREGGYMAGSSSAATGLSRRRMSNVTVLWEPEVEGLKRETSQVGLPLVDPDEEEWGGANSGNDGPQGSGIAGNAFVGGQNDGSSNRKDTMDSTSLADSVECFVKPFPAMPPHPSAALGEATLKRARVQVLTVLKHLYGANFHSGLLSNEGNQALEKNLYKLILDPGNELNEWRTLEGQLWVPMKILQVAKRWKRAIIVGPLATSFLFSRLAFLFELAVNFIKAHRSLAADLQKILGTGHVAAVLLQEVWREMEDAQRTIETYLPVFPDTFNSVKTEIATSVVLHHFRSLLEESHEMGILNERHYHSAIEACNDATNALSAHSHSESAPSYTTVLSAVGFLRFVSPEQVEELFLHRKPGKRRLFADVYVRANRKLLKRGAKGGGGMGGGWYVIVRGAVVAGDVILPPGTTLGMVELFLGEEVVDDYITSTLTHLLFFDKAAILQEAKENPELLKSLWWYLAVHELHQYETYAAMELGEVGDLLADAYFVHVVKVKEVGGEGEEGTGGAEGRLHKSKSGGSLRLLSLATIRHQLEGMSVAAGQSLRLNSSATTSQKQLKPRHHVLRVSGTGKDVLVMNGKILGPSVVSTPKNVVSTEGGQEGSSCSGKADLLSLFDGNNKIGLGRDDASSSTAAAPAAEQNGTLRGRSNLGRPPTFSSLTASGTTTTCKPILLSNFQGELWLEKGSIAFVIRREKTPSVIATAPTAPAPATPTPVGPLAAVRKGMRRTLSRRSSVSNLSSPPLFPPVFSSAASSEVEMPAKGFPSNVSASSSNTKPLPRLQLSWDTTEEDSAHVHPPHAQPVISMLRTTTLPSRVSSQRPTAGAKAAGGRLGAATRRPMARGAQTVTLTDFLDSACGEIDVEAAKKALARGETLAGFLSRQALAEESVSADEDRGGGGKENGRGGRPGTPPSLKQRITDSVSSPLTALFSREEVKPSSFLKEEEGMKMGLDEGGRGGQQKKGKEEERKRQPTALELMFMEGSGDGQGMKGGDEEVTHGDEQV